MIQLQQTPQQIEAVKESVVEIMATTGPSVTPEVLVQALRAFMEVSVGKRISLTNCTIAGLVNERSLIREKGGDA